MSATDQKYAGIWLHDEARRGQTFGHSAAHYDHSEDAEGTKPAAGQTRMRHAQVEQDGRQVAVWVLESWTPEQVADALNSNW